MEKIKNFIAISKMRCSEYYKHLIVLFLIYLLAFSALMRANYTYADDIGRTFDGYHGWLDWSRWTTQILATFIHAEWHLTDISPFPQILACFIMAVAGIIVLISFKEEREIDIWNISAISITALAPYFLGSISYKFNSPYMALSFLASVLPFLAKKLSAKIYALTSIFCLLVMCTSYQAYSGVYPMIALLLTMQDLKAGTRFKESINFLITSAICYLVSLCVFWLFLMRDNGVSVLSLSHFFPDTFRRYLNYYKTISSDFTWLWKALIVAIVFLFLYSFCHTAKIQKVLALLLGIAVIFINSILCFGAYLFISREAFDARAMNGFNIFLALLAVFISFHVHSYIPRLVYSALTWCFFVFSLTYGNALAQEQIYIDYRVQLAVHDLNDLDIMQTQKTKSFYVEGSIGMAPVNENMAKVYPILKRTIYNGFNVGNLGQYYICNYMNIPNIQSGSDDHMVSDLPVLKDTMLHTITGDENNIVLTFK